jgi:hypothetical protein
MNIPDKLKINYLPLNNDYKPDKKMIRLHKKLDDINDYYENKKFHKWLNNTSNNIKNEFLVNEMINDYIKLIGTDRKIINVKRFKDEMATFIYRNSNAQYKIK